jgi:hypothetical protein
VPDDNIRRPDFESLLEREVSRILRDPAFQRSPVQSRLLSFLCEQTVARKRSISQIAVAIDGLGRPEGADQLTESYPRVQISRLRQNLSLYYARCSPGEGLAVHIRRGDYRLRLAPPEKAYPPERRAGPAPPAANDSAPAASGAMSRGGDGGPSRGAGTGGRRWQAIAGLALILLAAAGIAALWHGRAEPGQESPTIAVEVIGGGQDESQVMIAYREAEGFAVKSFVVTRARPEASGDASYVLSVRPETGAVGGDTVGLYVLDRDGEVVFRDSVTSGDGRADFAARLDGRLAHISDRPESSPRARCARYRCRPELLTNASSASSTTADRGWTSPAAPATVSPCSPSAGTRTTC